MKNHGVPSAYTSGCALKQFCMFWNFSTQLIPFGSSSENTKQENASLNSGPQGPCAMPPRQGQSQLISPVSGLNAPPEAGASPDEASPSSSEAFDSGVVSESPSGAEGASGTNTSASGMAAGDGGSEGAFSRWIDLAATGCSVLAAYR